MKKSWKERYKESRNLQIFVVICGAILFYALITHLAIVKNAFQYILGILAPVIVAVIIAFLLSPVIGFLEKKLFGKFKRRKGLHAACVILTVLVICILLILLLYLLVSQVAASITHLLANFDNYVQALGKLIADRLGARAQDVTVFGVNLGDLVNIETSHLEEFGATVLNWATEHMDGIIGRAMSFGSNILNVFITLMLSIYMLMDIDHLKRSFSRFFRSVMEPDRYHRFARISMQSSRIFLRYFGSNLLDALIIGVAAYVFMLILRLPYSLLIAVIVGVFNLVPTFGPIVGAILSAFLILLVNPLGALWFIIYSIVSQFIDANLLKPKLFGDTTGLRPMWVLAAIIICGGLFGIVGMVLGVPLFAIFAIIMNERIEKRLQRWDYVKEDAGEEEKP